MPTGTAKQLTQKEIQEMKNEYQKGILSKNSILEKYKIGYIYANKILKGIKQEVKPKRIKSNPSDVKMNHSEVKSEGKIRNLNKKFKTKWDEFVIDSNIEAIYRRRRDSYCEYKKIFSGIIKTKNQNFLTFLEQGKINTITFSDFITGDVKINIKLD